MSAPNADKLFIAKEVGLWIRDLIKLYLSTELGLDAAQPRGECRFGDFMEVPVQLLRNMVPGVFVTFMAAQNKWASVDGSDFTTDYRYRIVYFAQVSTGENIETARMKGQRIADLLIANVGMEDPTVPGVYQSEGVYCLVDLIDAKPEENDIAQAINGDLYALAIECVCQLHTFTDD